jgi:hypothetical protein
MVCPCGQPAERVFPDLQGFIEVGGFDTEPPGNVLRNSNVLRHERQPEAGGESAGEDLLRDLALGGAVLPG